MTKAFIVNQVVVHDPARYADYAARGRAAMALHGGRILAAGGQVETLEGEPIPERVVIIEFPTREDALAYYHSPEYQAARVARGDAATVRFALVDGLD
ncbi:MAG TPA: DUF1330 domain-containing protein [Ilumatobacteraceae bacterium]|nr:DUF1330 domain-containing protein [Ilumatobacteraceae bacterium]HRB01903.1 DUF1330 domain-containing protein [Ilumatobacteraceae bacterium]